MAQTSTATSANTRSSELDGWDRLHHEDLEPTSLFGSASRQQIYTLQTRPSTDLLAPLVAVSMQVELALDTTTSLRPLLVTDGPTACANREDHRYSVSQVLWSPFGVVQPG